MPGRSWLRITTISAVAALVASAAACGSSAGPSSSRLPSSAQLSGTPIKLMAIYNATGPVQFPEIPISERAAAQAINNAGGVQGHPIQILTCDSKNDPNAAADCARQAVSEKVSAVVGMVGAEGASIMPILIKAGIPSVASRNHSALSRRVLI